MQWSHILFVLISPAMNVNRWQVASVYYFFVFLNVCISPIYCDVKIQVLANANNSNSLKTLAKSYTKKNDSLEKLVFNFFFM